MEPGTALIITKRLEGREVPCPKGVRNLQSTQKIETQTDLELNSNKSLHTLLTPCYCFYICLSRSNSFIEQTLLCVADGWMDCWLHGGCLLCLHFCLGTKLSLYACVCPSHIKIYLYVPKWPNSLKTLGEVV